MRSIRTKLFVSVGSIFLLIAILSYVIPHIFVRKDIDAASTYLNKLYSQNQKRLTQLSSSWISYRFVQEAAELSAIAQNIPIEKKSLWETASSLLAQDPTLSIVQVTDASGKTALISSESGIMHTPLYAKDKEGSLWLQIKEKQYLARALPQKENLYLLKEESNVPTLGFIALEGRTLPPIAENNMEEMYAWLKVKEGLILEKAKLIQVLVPYREEANGIAYITEDFKKGMALLSEDVFFTKAVLDKPSQHSEYPEVVYRETGPYVDLVQFVSLNLPYIAIGNSLSLIAAEISETISKPVLLYNKGELLQGFTANGKPLELDELQFEKNKVIWNARSYVTGPVTIGPLTFMVLIPEEERYAIQKVLSAVRDMLIKTLSYNMLLLSLGVFGIAMLLLARISKRLTKPITQLALASEEIGKGKYEGLELPPVEKRDDEIAILAHSFEQMAVSLRDREKIRGVLNKVVSKEIASTILNSSIELGGEERTLTMLFSDIRGFTPLSETMDPQSLISLLNVYMTRMCRIIDETHGVVDKFVGDEIMALYGAPLSLEHHAEKAMECALLMIADLKKWNRERGEPSITVGIGIHTGEAFAGNMGAEDRLNYTVVGANVNLAARLCSAAEPMQILVSEASYKTLANPEKFHFHQLAPILLKGIDQPVSIYELVSLS